MADQETDFNAPAELRKWPSLNNERMPNAWGLFLILFAKARLRNAFANLRHIPFTLATCMKSTSP